MRKIFFQITLVLFCLTNIGFNKIKATNGIKVSISNLRNNNGHILISLFKGGEGYPDKPEKAYRIAKANIADNKSTLLISNIVAGNYVIAILHDENDDQKMNKNFFGLPKEGYGFSNNVMGTFGPPSFNKAGFRYNNNTLLEIEIITKY